MVIIKMTFRKKISSSYLRCLLKFTKINNVGEELLYIESF